MRRSLRRWLSWGSRALGGTLALAAVGATAAAAQGPPPITLTGGHVDWGLKQSFRAYIGGPIAHGTSTASDGASINSDGTFRFSFASGTYDLAQHAVVSQFDGTVRFTGHDSGTGPALDLTISDPKLVTSGQTGTLFLDARSRSMSTGLYTDFDDVAFATLDLTGSTRTPGGQQIAIAPIASTLTSEGAAAFAGFYTAGTALDPMALTVSYARPAPPAPAPVEISPEPQPQPAVSLAAARMTQLDRPWNRNRKAAVARLVCRTGTCEVDAPRRVRLEVDGKRYRPAVIAPERLEQGERGTIRIQASRRALAALAGHEATSRLTFSVRSGDHRDWQTLELTLRRSGVTVG